MFIPFSDTSGKTGLVEDVDFLCSSDSVSYPLADKARNMNRHYYRVVSDILRSSGRWQFDDSNQASLPKVDLTMVNGTHEVALADTYMKVEYIEIKDLAGNYTRLKEIDFADRARSMSSFTTTSGFPAFYDVVGSYIYLDPAPSSASVTLTSGLRVWCAREVSAFVAGDTTKEPGFVEPYHRILSLGAAIDFIVVNGPTDKHDRLLQRYEALREELRTFYSDKNRDSNVQMRVRPVHTTRNYL